MMITRNQIDDQLIAYLRRQCSLAELVDWAEEAMMDGDFESADHDLIRDLVSRLGVSDVRAFDLSWQDCESMLNRLGYNVVLEIEPA